MVRHTSKLLLVAAFLATLIPSAVSAEHGAENSQRLRAEQARELAEEVLAGRELLVRVYNNWQKEPNAFELVPIQLSGLSIDLDTVAAALGQLGNYPVMVVSAEDQKDEVVAEVIGNFIYAALYNKGTDLSIWPVAPTKRPPDSWTVRDAAGNPIPYAKVQICLEYTVSATGRPRISGMCLKDISLDENGQFPSIIAGSKYWRFGFLFSHPDYGRASAVPHGQPVQYFVVPFAAMDLETASRNLWGTVVDGEGNPISGAVIQCGSVLSPGGVGTLAFPGRHIVPTDEQGRFFMTVPVGEAELAPLHSRYSIDVKLPTNVGGASVDYGHLPCGREWTITVERRQSKYFHTFSFEDANRPITDVNWLKKVRVMIDIGWRNSLSLKYDQWKEGGMFPLGTYRLAPQETKPLVFKPIEVTADSPELLVFQAHDGFVYYGRVVHGITGLPIAGAIVMAGGHTTSTMDCSIITPAQWQAIHALDIYPRHNHEALEPLRELCRAEAIVRSDEDGVFGISAPSGEMIDHLVVVEQDYLGSVRWMRSPVSRASNAPSLRENGLVEIAPVKLFPAATISLEPYIEDGNSVSQSAWIRVSWIIDRGNSPAWADDLALGRQWVKRKLRSNQAQSMHVPMGAGLSMQIQLLHPRHPRWAPIFLPKLSHLVQGQTLDLGRLKFEPREWTFPVYLKVVNSQGQPVEAVGVWCCRENRAFLNQGSTTNEEAIATFKLPVYSKGEFRVGFEGDGLKLKESIPFEIAGLEDANSLYTLQVPDEILYHLFR